MNDIEYIKEKLNTLRVKFMAQIFILIALGSGLSKMLLEVMGKQQSLSEKYLVIFDIGIGLFASFLVSIAFDLFYIDRETKKLKDKL